MFPRSRSLLLLLLLGLGKSDKFLRSLDLVFGDVSISFGEPFELANDDSLILQRISHRAIEEIARNKMIHPSQLVAKSMQGFERVDSKTLRENVEREVDSIRSFFKSRYRKEPPFHPVITSDLFETIQRGLKALTTRGAVSGSLFRLERDPAGNSSILRFYAYHADRRIYPLRGRNTMTVVNAGAWGYTLALHIGMNLLKKGDSQNILSDWTIPGRI